MKLRITDTTFQEVTVEDTLSDGETVETVIKAVIRKTDNDTTLEWLDVSPLCTREKIKSAIESLTRAFIVTDVVCSAFNGSIVDMFRELGFAPKVRTSNNIVGEVYVMHKSVVLD